MEGVVDIIRVPLAFVALELFSNHLGCKFGAVFFIPFVNPWFIIFASALKATIIVF